MIENQGEKLGGEEIYKCHSVFEVIIRVRMKKTGGTAAQVVKEMDEISDENDNPEQKTLHQTALRHIQEEDCPGERSLQVTE